MLSQEEHVEVMALAGRGWTISAIARHTGLNRRTVRAYIHGGRQPGQRRRSQPDVFAPFQRYVGQRLRDDVQVWATVLYDEVRELGYERSYQRFTAELRRRSLRPVCPDCLSARSRVTTEIAHEPGGGAAVGLGGAAGRSLGRQGAPAPGQPLPLDQVPRRPR